MAGPGGGGLGAGREVDGEADALDLEGLEVEGEVLGASGEGEAGGDEPGQSLHGVVLGFWWFIVAMGRGSLADN